MRLFFKWCLMLIMVYSFYSCSSFNYQFPDYEKIADKITEKTAKKLKKQRSLCVIGTGGQMMHDIQMMAMSFNYYHEVDLKVARELIIYAINEYLADINNNKEVRPYLHEYPFTAKNVEIRIAIYKPDGTSPPLDKIFYISAINGNLTYYRDLPETYSMQAMCKETYEEALKLVSNENDS